MKMFKTKIPADIGGHSLIGICSGDYPLSWGNYFTMSVNLNESISEEETGYGFQVCNFNYENFKEARSRFLPDDEVEVTMFQLDEERPFVAITDERIPQDWYHMWGEDMGYCNGGIAGEKWQETVDCLTDRFTNLKREGI